MGVRHAESCLIFMAGISDQGPSLQRVVKGRHTYLPRLRRCRMQNIIECVSEALTLDSQGASDRAVKKYLECMELIVAAINTDTDSNHESQSNINEQLKVIATNCVERLKELNSGQSSGLGGGERHARKSSGNIDVSLSALRRLHEKEVSASINNNSAPHSGHRRSPSLSSPTKMVKQSTFQIRLKMLLSSRQERRERLSGSMVIDWMRSSFASVDLSSLSAVLSRPPFNIVTAEEQKIFEALSANDCDLLSKAVAGFLTHRKEHPVVQLTDDFVKRLYHLTSTGTRQEIADDIHMFSKHFVDWFSQQWTVAPRKTGAIELGLHEYLMGTAIYSLLMNMYFQETPLFAPKSDLAFENILSTLGLKLQHADLAESYNMDFPVCFDPIILAPVLASIALIPACRTPSQKLSHLLKACSELCRLFPTDEIGGEELMRLLSLCLLRSPVSSHLPAEAAFMADLVPESMLRGEAGYVLATLQGAIDFVQQL